MNSRYHFDDVALLITVYNRSSSLERLLVSFADMGISFGEIVVSDDGSKPEHIEKLHSLATQYALTLVLAERNQGLGKNLNKGQRAVTKPYTLYVQEDFVPQPACYTNVSRALQVMKQDASVDLIRFYAYFRYPYTTRYNDDFQEMVFRPSLLYTNHLKFYMYSDHPHLRRSSFNQKFGYYPENVRPDLTEFGMCLSFLQAKGKALLMNDFKATFEQVNSSSEPSTIGRKSWKEKNTPLMEFLRSVFVKYRLVKNTLELKQHKRSQI